MGKKIISEFYKHEQFNGKDIGCAALKIIAKGTLIMVEKPQVTAKGVLISDGIFNLAQENITIFFVFVYKVEGSDFVHFFEDGTKVKKNLLRLCHL